MVKRLRHRPFTAVTRVRVSVGSPGNNRSSERLFFTFFVIRADACHGGNPFSRMDIRNSYTVSRHNFDAILLEFCGQTLKRAFRGQRKKPLFSGFWVETTGLVRSGATEQREQNGEEDGACGMGMQTNGAERRSVNAKRRRGGGGCGLREREQ